MVQSPLAKRNFQLIINISLQYETLKHQKSETLNISSNNKTLSQLWFPKILIS